jgi:hypothetical protein
MVDSGWFFLWMVDSGWWMENTLERHFSAGTNLYPPSTIHYPQNTIHKKTPSTIHYPQKNTIHDLRY